MVIVWLPQAEEALNSIHFYYSEKSLQAASKMISDIKQATERLVDYPEKAFREPLLSERPETFRSLIIKKIYKIIYYVNGDIIYIADIWNCRQNPITLRSRIG
jgi:plasmid stabilization system protein ParE